VVRAASNGATPAFSSPSAIVTVDLLSAPSNVLPAFTVLNSCAIYLAPAVEQGTHDRAGLAVIQPTVALVEPGGR